MDEEMVADFLEGVDAEIEQIVGSLEKVCDPLAILYILHLFLLQNLT
jgi:hypothetical protein